MAQALRGDAADRVVLAIAEALRVRRRLDRRDPRRQSGQWLRANWPAPLLLSTHRRRLVEALQADRDLRAETREVLRVTDVPAVIVGPGVDVAATLHESFASTSDIAQALAGAATDPDDAVALAAARYLLKELELPARRVRRPAPAPDASDVSRDTEHRRELREMRAARGQAEKALKTTARERDDAIASTRTLRAEVDQLRAELDQARAQLPTRRERAALAAAVTQERRIDALERTLAQTRERLAQEGRTSRREIQRLGNELANSLAELDAERRGRRQLEVELGDATARAARLLVLVEREREALDQATSTMRPGRDRTRALRRVESLRSLEALLREVYCLSGPKAAGSDLEFADDDDRPATTRPRGLKVTALGGANHIGGSCILVEAGDTRLLVDVGLRPNAPLTRPGPERLDQRIAAEVDAIFVTHAHADHAGFVPWVVGRRPNLPVLCSPETRALLPTVWADSARVMRAEADARSDGAEPPYSDADISRAEDALVPVGYGASRRIGSLEITAFRAGHILGAAGIVIRADDRRVVITGDIDDRAQLSIGPAQIPPRLAANADLLVIESTYCDSNHRDRERETADLIVAASNVLNRGGRILVPAFGLGRAQEIALLLRHELPDVEVRIDGLARAISDLYEQNGAPAVLGGRVLKVQDRLREIRGFRDGVVITTSGMLTGGAAIPWAQAVLSEPESALFLCGHQDEEAPGRELELLAEQPMDSPRRITLRDDQNRPVTVDVRAAIERYNLSAHADRRGLTGIVEQIQPKSTMLVHGERGPQAHFRTLLEGAGYRVVPNSETWDADAPISDPRRPRLRHAASAGRRGSRMRSPQ